VAEAAAILRGTVERDRDRNALLLDAQASIDVAPQVAELMAEEMGHDQSWVEEQVEAYLDVAKGYLMDPSTVSSPVR